MKSNWDIYPRPQMVRKDWLCLNGEWSFRTVGRDALGTRDNSEAAKDGQETINIPFCPESKLSGIGRRIDPGQTMIYEKEVTLPEEWKGRRILLHFGAVDQIAKVFINDRAAGEHEGGYLPFSFDITDLIYAKDEESEPPEEEKSIWAEDDEDEEPVSFVIRVEAVDELDHKYPWGKQKRNNGGMWYTPVSGIWQTVWLEPVNAEHIESLKIDSGEDWVEIRAYGIDSGVIELLGEKYRMDKEEGTDEKCASIHIDIHWPHTWSPEDPYLYNFTIETAFDKVGSYFALRTLTIEERGGYQRLCLNGEPYFFNGLLDQGYWKNGIYTPDDPQGFRRDIEAAKSL
ncbi:MAG: hypothetical protein E7220_05260, partial [Clostridiales bacterium]|nr:hypothetical protein [Clostridiales bacterium]